MMEIAKQYGIEQHHVEAGYDVEEMKANGERDLLDRERRILKKTYETQKKKLETKLLIKRKDIESLK
jgi:hypothetical protein